MNFQEWHQSQKFVGNMDDEDLQNAWEACKQEVLKIFETMECEWSEEFDCYMIPKQSVLNKIERL